MNRFSKTLQRSWWRRPQVMHQPKLFESDFMPTRDLINPDYVNCRRPGTDSKSGLPAFAKKKRARPDCRLPQLTSKDIMGPKTVCPLHKFVTVESPLLGIGGAIKKHLCIPVGVSHAQVNCINTSSCCCDDGEGAKKPAASSAPPSTGGGGTGRIIAGLWQAVAL